MLENLASFNRSQNLKLKSIRSQILPNQNRHEAGRISQVAPEESQHFLNQILNRKISIMDLPGKRVAMQLVVGSKSFYLEGIIQTPILESGNYKLSIDVSPTSYDEGLKKLGWPEGDQLLITQFAKNLFLEIDKSKLVASFVDIGLSLSKLNLKIDVLIKEIA